MRLRNADREARSSGRRNNVTSWISDIKGISSVTVRKKRGKRAPPTRRLRGKKEDQVTDNDDAVDDHIDDTNEGQVSGKTGDHELPETGQSGNSSDGPSSASEEQDHPTNSKVALRRASSRIKKRISEGSTRSKQDAPRLKHEGIDSEPMDQNDLGNEDGSHEQEAVNKAVVEESGSQEIKNDVSDAQVNTTSSDDKSSEEVEDVKVCDICGDVGEDEKLAVCSRCSDGAEHIYCMRVMMEEVPDSEWLCEDCQTEVEFEKEKKLDKCQEKAGTSKGQSCDRKTDKPVIAAKSGSSSEGELEAEHVGSKESDTVKEGNDNVNNKMEEDPVTTSTVREPTIPEPGGSYLGADSRKGIPLSHEISSGFDTDKGKQPNRQVATSFPSAPKNQAPHPRGQLSKSTSFNNSKVPKVQLLTEAPQKPKNLKESWSSILKKEGPISMTTKSATFKKPKPCDPSNKAKSSILSPPEEPRAKNQLVSQNITNDKCSSILGTPSTTASTVTPFLTKADTIAQPLATGNNMADSNKLGNAHGQSGKSSLGNSELKKPLLPKVPGITMISNAERSSGILGSGAQRKVPHNSDTSNQDNKMKDLPAVRGGASNSNRAIRCQKCNEAGHSTQFCAVDKLRLSAMKPLSERNLKDACVKRNKTSETCTLAATEKAGSRLVDLSEQFPKCGTYQNPIQGPKDVLPARKPSPLLARANEQDLRNSLSTPGNAAAVDCSKLPNLSAMSGISADNGPLTSDRTDESSQGFSTGDEPTASTIPELDYIWQGGFELQRTGKSPELCDGFQAHLSCSASQSVLDVAKKIPSKVQLEEVPRQNSWPTQFQESGPTYNNVGLFFFARDVQSYENHYCKLVENMLKNDLVLRGSVGTVELLIFPSNILSKNFQKWNMLYFLWGVFRVSRKDCSNLPPPVPTTRCGSNSNEVPPAMDPSRHSFSRNSNSVSKPVPNLVKSASCADQKCLPTLEVNHQACLNGECSLKQPVSGRPLDGHSDSVAAKCSTNNKDAINHSATATERKRQEPDYSEQDKTVDTFDGNVSGRNFDVNTVPSHSSSLTQEKEPGKESTTINLNDTDDLMDIDHDLMDIDHVDTTEVNTSAPDLRYVSGGPRKREFEKANGMDAVDGTSEYKKIKLDNAVPANLVINENCDDGMLLSKVHPLAASSVEDGTDNNMMAASSNSAAKRVFPLDLNTVDDAAPENIVNIPSSDDEDLPGSVSSKLGEKQKGDNLPTDMAASSLSLSLAIPSGKEQGSKLQSVSQRQLPERSSKSNASSIWGQQ